MPLHLTGNCSCKAGVSTKRMGGNWILAAFFAVFGIPALIVGATMLARRIASITRGRLIEAEVVRFDTHRLPAAVKRAPQQQGSVAKSTVTPHVRYTAEDGTEMTAKYDQQVTRKVWTKHPIGSLMPVRIDPRRPHVAYDPSAGSMFVFPGLLLFAGLLMTLLALGIAFGAPSGQ